MQPLTRGEKVRRALVVVLLTAALLAGVDVLVRAALDQQHVSYRDGGTRLVRVVNGLLFATTFSRPPSPAVYSFNGSAVPEDRYVLWQPGDLGIGVYDHGRTTFQGFFAVTRASFPAGSYVQTLMTPYPATRQPHAVAENVLAVQTANTRRTGLINYVVLAYTQTAETRVLQIGFAEGIVRRARTVFLRTLHVPPLARMPITLTTDGFHRYSVWFGSSLLYGGEHLNMVIPPPFQVYLEVQARDTDYTSEFRNLFVYRGRSVLFTGLPAGARVLWQAGGRTFSAQAVRGRARFSLPPTDLAGTGPLAVHAPGLELTFPHVRLQGGDVFLLEQGPLGF